MKNLTPPKSIKPGSSLEGAVYCANCQNLKLNQIGGKSGTCFGFPIPDSNIPLQCQHYQNDRRIISVFVFLKSGISIYHKAIVKDLKKEVDPDLIASFLQAINMFGEQLANEQISSIQLQKMNIVYVRGKFSNGAMIIKGNIDEISKEGFSYFISKLESSYPDFFDGGFAGQCLPEEEVDQIATESLKEFVREKLYPIPPKLVEKACHFKCGSLPCRKKN